MNMFASSFVLVGKKKTNYSHSKLIVMRFFCLSEKYLMLTKICLKNKIYHISYKIVNILIHRIYVKHLKYFIIWIQKNFSIFFI